MFVIENYLKSQKTKLAEWEEARAKVEAEADYNETVYRWEKRNPKPKSAKNIIATAWRATVVLGVIAFIAFMIIGFVREYNSPENVAKRAESAQQKEAEERAAAEARANDPNAKDCKSFNKGDYVRVQRGTYEGVEGNIIGGCEKDVDYQIQIVVGTANFSNDGQGEVDVSGNTIGVDAASNLTVVERVENAEHTE